VIQLLEELKGKVEGDLATETQSVKEYLEFCDDELSEKAFAIKTAKREADGSQAQIEEAGSVSQRSLEKIEEVSSISGSKEAELESANGVRKAEAKDFEAAEKELLDAIDALSRAAVILKRELSLLSVNGGDPKASEGFKKKMDALRQPLSLLIESSLLVGVSKAKAKLKSFLAQGSFDELSLLSARGKLAQASSEPRASTYNYENHSGGIIETLDQMKDQAEGNLQTLRRDELKAKQAHQLLVQSLSDALANLKKESQAASSAQSSAQEKLGRAEEDLSQAEASSNADKEYSASLKQECEAKQEEFNARKADGNAEIKAINQAKEILSGGVVVSLAQASASLSRSNNDSTPRDALVQLLKRLGHQYNSFGLLQLANAAVSDPFAKVRSMIESMISKLLEQANEEATHDSFCRSELSKSKKAHVDRSNRADETQSRIDEANANIALGKEQIAELESELHNIVKASKQASTLRAKEKAAYEKSSSEYKQSITAVNNAISVLSEYYRNASLLQTERRDDAGHMIIEVLTNAEAEFSKTLATIEANESKGVAVYNTLTQENHVSKAAKETEKKGKQSELRQLSVALKNHSEDRQTVSDELDALNDYLDKLKAQCQSKAMTYDERKQKREAEIQGLKEALGVLAGSVGSSFLQRR
jgi:hypothetical protein